VPNLPDLTEQLSVLVGEPVSLTFAQILVVHVIAGMTCVITGAVALTSRKQRGRHHAYGEVYYWGLALVFATATALAAMRWEHSAYLFVLGAIAFGVCSLGYAARKLRWHGWLSIHLVSMGLSYIVLMTAFYVDNGPKLPVWNLLPSLAFWLGPSVIGVPLLVRAMRRYGRVRSQPQRLPQDPSTSSDQRQQDLDDERQQQQHDAERDRQREFTPAGF
jgi:hypothetical protein